MNSKSNICKHFAILQNINIELIWNLEEYILVVDDSGWSLIRPVEICPAYEVKLCNFQAGLRYV